MPIKLLPIRICLGRTVLSLAMVWGGVAFSASDYDTLIKLAQQRYGANAAKTAVELQQLIASSRSLSEIDKLKRINEFINRKFQFVDDSVLWKQADYWATPLEMMGKSAGDCEDFAIIKYTALKDIGVSTDKLRLSYVKAKIGGVNSNVSQAHMVLTYYAEPDAEPLILDNLITEIRPASRRPDLTPVFSFNHEGVFAGSGVKPSASIDRLSRWKDVLLRMQADGIDYKE
ncbi:transglutaminase [Deefgea chitinilytica]|uniref:Transglutaminase n=1 Tax=Deefgea chitinilytica TaxID=570276 RepID=A0ABS2CED4_9NEIS|nr:transglutaminase [Deefgea chitinilytica]MBM9889735.1 transglutaminase-like cysteine peptidase [Deefgea sp. CFH1-16]